MYMRVSILAQKKPSPVYLCFYDVQTGHHLGNKNCFFLSFFLSRFSLGE